MQKGVLELDRHVNGSRQTDMQTKGRSINCKRSETSHYMGGWKANLDRIRKLLDTINHAKEGEAPGPRTHPDKKHSIDNSLLDEIRAQAVLRTLMTDRVLVLNNSHMLLCGVCAGRWAAKLASALLLPT